MNPAEETPAPTAPLPLQTRKPLWLSQVIFFAALAVAGASLSLAFWLIERGEAGLVVLALAGSWAAWAYFFRLRKAKILSPSVLPSLAFAGLVILAGWSLVSGASWWLGLICLATSLAAWDLDAFLQRNAHLRVAGAAERLDWAGLQRSHLRLLGFTLGAGMLAALLSIALALALRLQIGVWVVLGFSAAGVAGLIWLARVVLFEERKR